MYLGHQMGPANGRGGAMGLMYGMLQQQAALRSYVDVFRWTALLAFFCAGRFGCSGSRKSMLSRRRGHTE
jgi:hypothetical protein